MRLLRDAIATVATKRFPGALPYLAEKNARQAAHVAVSDRHIDIIRNADRATIRISRANAVYVPDLINSFEYYFGSVVSRDGIVDFSSPRPQHIVGFDDFPIVCPSLAEPFVTAQQYLDAAQLPAGGIVLDLGAYSGLTSIAFAKAVGPTGRVIALEPDPINYAAARANIATYETIAGTPNIHLAQMAVAGSTGTMALSSEGAMGSAAASVVGRYRGNTVPIPACTLSDLAARFDLPKVDFIKMDIEGSEEPVLAASEDFFRRYRPKLVIEPHIVNKTLSDVAVRAALSRFGYRCETIEQTGVSLPLVVASPLH